MTDVNWGLELLKLVPTTIIGSIVAYVAFMQWRTAHQKVVLDLFERRLKLYHELINTVHFSLTADGASSIVAVSRRIQNLYSSSRFLFGIEVSNAILEIRVTAAHYGYAFQQKENRSISSTEREEFHEDANLYYKKTMSFEEAFTALCLPYMLMNQKRVRNSSEWFRDKNNDRLSYADKKQ